MNNRKGKKKYGYISTKWCHKNSHMTKAMHRLYKVIKADAFTMWRTVNKINPSD